MAGTFTLPVEQGSTLRMSVVVSYDAGGDDFEPYDFTGATARMTFRERATTPILLQVTTSDGAISVGNEPGRIDIVLTDTQTARLRRGRYDLVVTFPSGDVRRILAGPVAIV